MRYSGCLGQAGAARQVKFSYRNYRRNCRYGHRRRWVCVGVKSESGGLNPNRRADAPVSRTRMVRPLASTLRGLRVVVVFPFPSVPLFTVVVVGERR